MKKDLFIFHDYISVYSLFHVMQTENVTHWAFNDAERLNRYAKTIEEKPDIQGVTGYVAAKQSFQCVYIY